MLKNLINRLRGRRDETPEEQQKETVSPVEPDVPEESAEKEQEKKEHLPDIESSSPQAVVEPAEPIDKEDLKNRIVEAMKTIYDPEIPVNVYDIGLIYKIEPQDDGVVQLARTLTTRSCPAAGILPGEIESKARGVEGVRDVDFELTFAPPWNPEMMSEGARLELGMM